MNQQTLELAATLVCLLISMAGAVFFMASFNRWLGPDKRTTRLRLPSHLPR